MHMQDFCFKSKVVRSLVLDAGRCGAQNYWQLWREYLSGNVCKNYVEHASCHVTIDVFSHQSTINTW